MTKRDKDAIIGRMTSEYSEARKECTLLEQKLRHLAQFVEPLALLLRRGDSEALREVLDHLPEKADLLQLVEDYEAQRNLVTELKEKLRDCGVSF